MLYSTLLPSATCEISLTDMKQPLLPDNEKQRLHALDTLDIAYTPGEERFDRVTRIAQRLFKVPIVLVSLVTQDKQWFKSRQGLDAAETSRQISFCGHAILSDDPFVVANAMKDPDFKDNPLVTGPPDIRFYAGQPLHFDGYRIGTLCIIDTKPRQLRPADYDSLKNLAHWVELELQDWHRSKNTFIRRMLNPEHRETLLDPLTGSLNTAGVQLIKQKISEHGIGTRHFVLEFDLDDDAGRERLRVILANSLRVLLDDFGILGFTEPSHFDLFLIEQEGSAVDELISKIEKVVDEVRESDTTGLAWTWRLTELQISQ